MFWIFKKSSRTLDRSALNRIDVDATQIVQRLKSSGFESYLVGGCVRDLLLGQAPKDFDIATSASPQKVRNLIPRSFVIGRRFRIVVAKRPSKALSPEETSLFPTPSPRLRLENEFQITTFRREPETVGDLRNENVFGTAREDAFRRDFTINGLFLDPSSGRVIDHVQGLRDIESQLIRMIGNPEDRFREDPIRILRALRFASRTGFALEKSCERALIKNVATLKLAKPERIREELLKILKEGTATDLFNRFAQLKIWAMISPAIDRFQIRNPEAFQQMSALATASKRHWHPGLGTSPLLFLLFFSLMESSDTEKNQLLSQMALDLKISKAEKEEMSRISGAIRRLLKAPKLETLLSGNPRPIQNLSQTLFCIEALANADLKPWSEIWNSIEEDWKTFAKENRPRAQSPNRERSRPRRSRRPRFRSSAPNRAPKPSTN